MKARVLALVAVVLAIATVTCLGNGVELGEGPFLLSTAQDLLSYPAPNATEARPLAERLFTVVLPSAAGSVILRPLSEEEFGSFQIQAIDAQLIDLQMLAVAIVLPAVAPADVAGLSAELIGFLHRMVNEISGFVVFADVLLP